MRDDPTPNTPNPDRRRALSVLSAAGLAAPMLAATKAPPPPGPAPGGQPLDSTQLRLPPGVYRGSDFQPSNGDLRIVAEIPGTVRILIDDGRYFQDIPGFMGHCILDGLIFVGGKGALRLGRTGANVAGMVEITRCTFVGYTECAIGNNASDQPYLRVRDCSFACAPGANGIGIAWGGFVDSGIIEANAFVANRYHIKIGPRLSGSFHIRMNDFILGNRMTREADIWIVPNQDANMNGVNSGFGGTISENKFGNENQTPGKPRILVAGEDASSGADRLSRGHDTTWLDDAFLSGITIANNRISGIGASNAPFLLSNISELRYLSWLNNKMDGGAYDYAIAFSRDRKPTRSNAVWRTELSGADGPALPRYSFCNQPLLSGDPD